MMHSRPEEGKPAGDGLLSNDDSGISNLLTLTGTGGTPVGTQVSVGAP